MMKTKTDLAKMKKGELVEYIIQFQKDSEDFGEYKDLEESFDELEKELKEVEKQFYDFRKVFDIDYFYNLKIYLNDLLYNVSCETFQQTITDLKIEAEKLETIYQNLQDWEWENGLTKEYY